MLTTLARACSARTPGALPPELLPFIDRARNSISVVFVAAGGCPVCKRTGWLEILGSGMVHPVVFEYFGYDAERVTGFAFGMGIERVAVLKWGVDDIRLFYENDLASSRSSDLALAESRLT